MARIEAEEADREAIEEIVEAGVNVVLALIDYARDVSGAPTVQKAAKAFTTKLIDFAESD